MGRVRRLEEQWEWEKEHLYAQIAETNGRLVEALNQLHRLEMDSLKKDKGL